MLNNDHAFIILKRYIASPDCNARYSHPNVYYVLIWRTINYCEFCWIQPEGDIRLVFKFYHLSNYYYFVIKWNLEVLSEHDPRKFSMHCHSLWSTETYSPHDLSVTHFVILYSESHSLLRVYLYNCTSQLYYTYHLWQHPHAPGTLKCTADHQKQSNCNFFRLKKMIIPSSIMPSFLIIHPLGPERPTYTAALCTHADLVNVIGASSECRVYLVRISSTCIIQG